jgi:hypothetical protein
MREDVKEKNFSSPLYQRSVFGLHPARCWYYRGQFAGCIWLEQEPGTLRLNLVVSCFDDGRRRRFVKLRKQESLARDLLPTMILFET